MNLIIFLLNYTKLKRKIQKNGPEKIGPFIIAIFFNSKKAFIWLKYQIFSDSF